MIRSLRDHTDELINRLAEIDRTLAGAGRLPDLDAAKALVELSRLADRAEKLLTRVRSLTAPATHEPTAEAA